MEEIYIYNPNIRKQTSKEMVNHPDHYNVNGLECIDVMLKLYGREAVLAFCQLNAFKYQFRANRKNNCKEDLQKARWYINKFLELLEENV